MTDDGLTETMNQAAREYETVLHNNVWMHFPTWQRKLVRAEVHLAKVPKVLHSYVIQKILHLANGAQSTGPNPNMYKSPEVKKEGLACISSSL